MKNVLILHGAANNSQGNWFPWLKSELESRGYKVWVPDLPNDNKPVLKEWLETIFSNRDWKFDQDSLLVGHSSGATLILRILEKLPEKTKINKAILVAGPLDKGNIPAIWDLKEGITRVPFNWQKIKNKAKEVVLIYSDNDPYDCGQRHGKVIQSKIGGRLIVKKEEAHFNLEKSSKYIEFPELLEYIDSGSSSE